MSLGKLKDTFTDRVSKPLAVGVLALSLAFPMAANANDASTNQVASVSKTALFDISKQAYVASKELGVVGVYVNRAHDVEESEAQIRDLTTWLLEEAGINKHYVVSGQATKTGGVTSFTIFVDKEAKQYLFSSLEQGIKTAKVDVDNSIRAARHDQTIAMNHD